jgi:hypothetical protein
MRKGEAAFLFVWCSVDVPGSDSIGTGFSFCGDEKVVGDVGARAVRSSFAAAD